MGVYTYLYRFLVIQQFIIETELLYVRLFYSYFTKQTSVKYPAMGADHPLPPETSEAACKQDVRLTKT